MKYIIVAQVGSQTFWVKINKSTGELRGLKDHATEFDSKESAYFWVDVLLRQSNLNKRNSYTIKPKNYDESAAFN